MNLDEALKRLNALSLPQGYPKDVDLLRLIDHKMFLNCVSNELKSSIMALIGRGITSATELSKYLRIPRTSIYRHLNILLKSGLLIRKNGRYFVSAKMFLVYDCDIENNGYIRLRIHPDKGGFIDEDIGFVSIKGESCKCDVCNAYDNCIKAVKNFAKKLDIRIRSENPMYGFIEIVREIVYRDVLQIVRNGYLIAKPIHELEENQG
ncbi:MAG: winged helix-turn-helix domain-containing protein [Ignisphaera sp.]